MPIIPLTMVLVTAFVVLVPLAMLALVLAPEQLAPSARRLRRSVEAAAAAPTRTISPASAPTTIEHAA